MPAVTWCCTRSSRAAVSGKPGTRNSTDEMNPTAWARLKSRTPKLSTIRQYTPDASTAQAAVMAYWL